VKKSRIPIKDQFVDDIVNNNLSYDF